MKSEYDFSRGRRGPIIPVPRGKTRITIRLDKDLIDWFRSQVEAAGGALAIAEPIEQVVSECRR